MSLIWEMIDCDRKPYDLKRTQYTVHIGNIFYEGHIYIQNYEHIHKPSYTHFIIIYKITLYCLSAFIMPYVFLT